MALTFGKVPKPRVIVAHVPKPGPGAGYTQLNAKRSIVGSCVHCWDGWAWTTPAWKSIYDLFAKDRVWDALVDYSIQRDGTIVELNDPFGTRSPWANGGSDGLEGDGVGFVRTLGVSAINDRLVSVENENKGEPLNDAMLDALARLVAWIHDQAKQPWSEFPFHPKFGCVTQMQHYEFATKGCPLLGIEGQTDAYQNRARQIMKTAQESVIVPDPVEPPAPVENPSNKAWPNGWTTKELTARFGRVPFVDAAGKSSTRGFDEDGQISNAWVQRAVADKITEVAKMPKPVRFVRTSTGETISDLIVFDGVGEKDPILFNPKSGSRANYRWLV